MAFGASAATIAAIVSAAASVGGATVAAVESDRGATRSRQGRRLQDKAQKDSAAEAAAQLRRNEEAQRGANRKTPNVGDLLTSEQADRVRGPQSTLLTQAGKGKPTLGKTTLLGS